jgi:hypothetical protein
MVVRYDRAIRVQYPTRTRALLLYSAAAGANGSSNINFYHGWLDYTYESGKTGQIYYRVLIV